MEGRQCRAPIINTIDDVCKEASPDGIELINGKRQGVSNIGGGG